MRHFTHRLLALLSVAAIVLASSNLVLAQTAPAQPDGSRDTPRPQDIDPAVDTSASAPPEAPVNAPTAPERNVDGAAPAATGAQRPSGASTSAPKRGAVDRIELDTTEITGNRELPKVLYIVPWKRADLGDLQGRPVNSLLDEVLTPVDRDVFKRENRYYRALMPEPSQAPTGSAAPALRDER